jgi:hypothetical protein
MPGFLGVSGYDGTEKIDLGNGYFAEVKRCLSAAEYQRVLNYLGTGRQNVRVDGGPQTVNVDPYAAMTEMLAQSLVSWNIDDEDETVWPLQPDKARRASIARLPPPVLMSVYQRCDELNGPRKTSEAARFPGETAVGDPDGDGGAAGTDGVPD